MVFTGEIRWERAGPDGRDLCSWRPWALQWQSKGVELNPSKAWYYICTSTLSYFSG